ncbi:sulfurtransferase [Oceanicoccus sp. KOV_DT_Chl]|uniref:sulfurtransferase n=1 Tax=Oceanicoccus sp. KOV_DT_Chl TaxID=1904639 RepID=UPI001F1E0443|nr:sulfurtransferase [Oceanicoccus sp. KOV_DT_Chl]
MFKYLISAAKLADCYQQPNVVVIDCRFSLADTEEGERNYQQAHISGAHYLHLDKHLSGIKSVHGGRHPLPDSETLAAILRDLGVNQQTLIVAYDDHRFAFASRLWWLLRYLGHDNVKVLDGGFSAWRQLDLPVDNESPIAAQSGNFSATLNAAMVVDINEVKTIPHSQSSVLIDSREKARFLGQQEPIDPIAGHINGAVNFPWQEVTDAQGLMQADPQQRWGDVLAQEDVVVYCGSGVTACVNLLALAESGGRMPSCMLGVE